MVSNDLLVYNLITTLIADTSFFNLMCTAQSCKVNTIPCMHTAFLRH